MRSEEKCLLISCSQFVLTADVVSKLIRSVRNILINFRLKLDQLKQSCGQELVNVDICVKTRDTPASMQYDNTAPMTYFSRLVAHFEQLMLDYRQAIQNAEQHLESLSSGQCFFKMLRERGWKSSSCEY